MLENVVAEVAERLSDRAALESEAAQLEEQIDRLVELAAEVGDVKTTARQIQERRARLAIVRADLATSAPAPSREEIRRLAEDVVGGLREILRQDGREALRHLLGPERLRIEPDGEGGYHVRGTARIEIRAPGITPTRGEGSGGRI